MQPRSLKLLEDIRDATAFIRDTAHGKAIDDYHRECLLRQAVERNFEIIGEAIRRLAQHDPEAAAGIGNYRQIIAFRNVLIHGYDLVDHALVWSANREPGSRAAARCREIARNRRFSERRLIDCLTSLGRDVQIVIKEAPRRRT